MVPPTRVVSTSIWYISWRHSTGGCSHPWRVYVIPHGPIFIRVSLYWVLTMLLSLWVFHCGKLIFNSELDSCRILTLINLPSEFLTHYNMHPYWKNRATTKRDKGKTILPKGLKLAKKNEMKLSKLLVKY